MNISKTNPSNLTDDTGHRIVNRITENIALNEELRYKPQGTKIDMNGERFFDEGQLWGFDIETAPYEKLISYYTDARVTKRGESLKSLVLKYCMVRFPNETARDKVKLINVIKTISITDFEMLQAEAKNDEAWFGDSGLQNQIWLDPTNPINKKNVKMVKTKNDGFLIKRK